MEGNNPNGRWVENAVNVDACPTDPGLSWYDRRAAPILTATDGRTKATPLTTTVRNGTTPTETDLGTTSEEIVPTVASTITVRPAEEFGAVRTVTAMVGRTSWMRIQAKFLSGTIPTETATAIPLLGCTAMLARRNMEPVPSTVGDALTRTGTGGQTMATPSQTRRPNTATETTTDTETTKRQTRFNPTLSL